MNIKDEIRKINEQATQIRLITDEIIDHLPQEKKPVNKESLCFTCKYSCLEPNDVKECAAYINYKKQPTKEMPDILNAIKEVMIRLYYEELHPINENTTAEDLKNRKEKAIDEYLGRNQKLILYPILHAKVDKAMAHIAKAIQEISALYRKVGGKNDTRNKT